jgi:ArsR family transcriptional regulator
MSVAPATVRTSERTDESELASLAKALGHPARVQIVRLLLSRDACYCGEIVDELPLAQATVSQHLKVLKEAGLIRGEIEGLRTGYCADRERLTALHRLIGALLHEAVALSEDRCGDDD